jgi:sodium transport system ATP-binding protein
MSAPVVVTKLAKVFYDEARGEIKAVDSISFECRKGEIFGLLGSNGAGKTTALRMLSTVLAPTSGTASLMGHDVVKNPEGVRKNLGFYSATTSLYPRLTTRETIEFFTRINQYPPDRVAERVSYLIHRFGLGKYADARIDKLSSGMKQKVSIARTIAHDPAILIFDEPTVGLDVLNALDVQQTIGELRSEGKTIIFSTHIMSEAERLCDHIAIIHDGRILASASLSELRTSTGEYYLENIFLSYVKDAGAGTSGNDERMRMQARMERGIDGAKSPLDSSATRNAAGSPRNEPT